MPQKNLAFEMLKKQMLDKAIKTYTNKSIETAKSNRYSFRTGKVIMQRLGGKYILKKNL